MQFNPSMSGFSLFGGKPKPGMSDDQLRYNLLRFGNEDHRFDAEIVRRGWYPKGENGRAWVFYNGGGEARLLRWGGDGLQVAAHVSRFCCVWARSSGAWWLIIDTAQPSLPGFRSTAQLWRRSTNTKKK